MYSKKSNLWAAFSLFMLLALILTGCNGFAGVGAQANTTVPTANTLATQVPARPATAMPTAMNTAMPTTMNTAMPAAPAGTQTAPAVMAPTPASFTLVVGTNATLGNYLTDQNGRALYILVKDTPTVSNCNGTCAALWPPLIGTATAGSGVTASMIGVITRQDGSSQVTYNGHPLYYLSKDVNPQDVNGQGFGNGNWWVLSPSGAPINTMLSGSPTAPAMPSGTTTATP
ncbi:MAG TPA: hypothetical protein VKF38_07205 [Anaerolineaceae bacterium]|nr:hypothetical protein [Anaerolineaceae bacterium]